MTLVSKEKYYLVPKGKRSIHIKGSDDPDKEIASEIVFHFLENGDLLFELFTHNEIAKVTGIPYIQFNIKLSENPDLLEFWNEFEQVDIKQEREKLFLEAMKKSNPDTYMRMRALM